MSRPKLIPETGQEVEVVRLHPIDWSATVTYIRELKQALSIRALIINDNFSIDDRFLIDSLIQYCRNYMLTIHFNHYQRLSVDIGAWTPAKGRAFYSEEVPEVFISIARHLARPRILIDGSISLPIPDAPICNGVRYGGLAALTDADVVRNQISIGPATAVLHAIEIYGTRVEYRHRLYLSLRRNFAGLKFTNISKPEGLHPIRMCYWRNGLNRFVSLLNNDDPFEKAAFELDTILQPITFPALISPGNAPLIPADVDVNDAAAIEYGRAAATYHRRMFPRAIQWLATDYLSGNHGAFGYSIFMERETSSQFSHPALTNQFARMQNLAGIKEDLDAYHFPELGTIDHVDEIRVLVNDLGTGRPGNARNNRRTDNYQRSASKRRFKAAAKAMSTVASKGETDVKDNGAATLETIPSQESPADGDTLRDDKKTKSKFVNRRRKKKDAKASA